MSFLERVSGLLPISPRAQRPSQQVLGCGPAAAARGKITVSSLHESLSACVPVSGLHSALWNSAPSPEGSGGPEPPPPASLETGEPPPCALPPWCLLLRVCFPAAHQTTPSASVPKSYDSPWAGQDKAGPWW